MKSATKIETGVQTFKRSRLPDFNILQRARAESHRLSRSIKTVIAVASCWIAIVVLALIAACIFTELSSNGLLASPKTNGARAAMFVRGDVSDITNRPLFDRTRKLSAAIVAPPPPPLMRDRQLSLKGIFIDGSVASALIASAEFPKGRWSKIHDTAAGWRVEKIEAGLASLSADDETLTLILPNDASPR